MRGRKANERWKELGKGKGRKRKERVLYKNNKKNKKHIEEIG